MAEGAAQDAMDSHVSKFAEAIIALVPAAFAFILGWAYLTSYLARFNVDITEIEVPLITTFIFSYPVILRFDFLITVMAIFALVYFGRMIPDRTRWWRALRSFRYVVCLGAIVVLIPLFAEVAAMQKADSVWKGSSFEARLSLKEEGNKAWIADYRKCAAERRVKLVFDTPGETILICRSKYTPCNYGDVYIVGSDGTLKSRRGVSYAARDIWPYDSRGPNYLGSPARYFFGSGGSGVRSGERNQCVGSNN
ncbi:MAG: hypothetical protein VYD57_14965 [Pseudomonadota bacterium]|nr:hypothetical protein [Pseudomonadota bacterium]